MGAVERMDFHYFGSQRRIDNSDMEQHIQPLCGDCSRKQHNRLLVEQRENAQSHEPVLFFTGMVDS